MGRQLWLMRADGTEAQALTDSPDHNHGEIRWRSDGSALVYLRFNLRTRDEEREIWWYDLETGEAHLLVEGGYAPQWIP